MPFRSLWIFGRNCVCRKQIGTNFTEKSSRSLVLVHNCTVRCQKWTPATLSKCWPVLQLFLSHEQKLKLQMFMCEFSEHAVKIVRWQFSQTQRHHGLSVDRQSTSVDACLRAGIMPAPTEIIESDLGPVWSSAPSHYAHIFSGLQVSGHDSILEKWTEINHYPFDGSVISTLFFFFLCTKLTATLYFDLSNHKLMIDSLVLRYLVSI